jgi:ribosomal protein S18 acetylase RimI-like enzyme
MSFIQITNRDMLADYFRQDTYLHLYSLGDLDDFYWPRTQYFGLESKMGLKKVVLIYKGEGLPIFLALSSSTNFNGEDFQQLINILPDQIYAHLSSGFEDHFRESFTITDHGQHFKMGLIDSSIIPEIDTTNTIPISNADLEEVEHLYQISYPNNAFDPRMLLTGQYFGYRKNNQLLCVGGVHVYSKTYGVAALGNITTHPDFRNQGLARIVTAKICSQLMENINIIGLNVKSDNTAAVHLYLSLGFKICAKYGEFTLKKAH